MKLIFILGKLLDAARVVVLVGLGIVLGFISTVASVLTYLKWGDW